MKEYMVGLTKEELEIILKAFREYCCEDEEDCEGQDCSSDCKMVQLEDKLRNIHNIAVEDSLREAIKKPITMNDVVGYDPNCVYAYNYNTKEYSRIPISKLGDKPLPGEKEDIKFSSDDCDCSWCKDDPKDISDKVYYTTEEGLRAEIDEAKKELEIEKLRIELHGLKLRLNDLQKGE